jgi:arsenite-transporting ATPase
VATPSFLDNPALQLILFGGKGGVGKTTCATATALRFARNLPPKSFLLVSTDPAPSLADSMAGFPPPPNLRILELNTQECLTTFKMKHNPKLRQIAARGTFLDDEDINQFLDLSLPGMDELLAFLEISSWVEDRSYDGIIVDTAPTGHTLRLLSMPEFLRKWLEALDALLAKHRYMKRVFGGSYRRDELDFFLEKLSISLRKMETLLQDPGRCRFVPVMLAEALSIRETDRMVGELERLKVPLVDIVINKLYPENTCPVCADGRSHQMRELKNLFGHRNLSGYLFWGIPVYPVEVRGIESLDMFWGSVEKLTEETPIDPKTSVDLAPWVEAAAPYPSPETTLLLFAGKGGVGKTTLACATAVRLAHDLKGKQVLLFSTDPAHSLSACLDVPIGPKPTRLSLGLTAMEIDAQAEFDSLKVQYQKELERFLKSFSPNLDFTFDREVMEKILDLSPPGLDEIMALTRIMEFLAQGSFDVFILDSAPTGHLIRLLELPELIDQWLKVFFGLFLKYKRVFRLPQISQCLVQMSKNLKRLRTLLHDPTRSALYAVSILTEMAFQETKDLMAACKRMGVHVPVLFLNLATPPSECSLCSALSQRESQVKDKFQRTFSGRHQTLVYRQGEPCGLKQLGDLGQALYQPMGKESRPHRHRKEKAEGMLAHLRG